MASFQPEIANVTLHQLPLWVGCVPTRPNVPVGALPLEEGEGTRGKDAASL